jgi:hypothetical protein
MHYNELQARSAEVEAMAMNFEQRAADAVSKAGLKGPNRARRISVENPTSELATPPIRKKDKKR